MKINQIDFEKISKYEMPQRVVYFLCNDDDEILYIGKAKNLPDRVASHIRVKPFQRIYYFEMGDRDINAIERYFIDFVRPPMNIIGVKKGAYSEPLRRWIKNRAYPNIKKDI